MRCILMLLLVLPLCGCTAAPPIGAAETPAVTASPAATTPMPPAPLDESLAMLYLLAASTWQDIYDENYTLSFDVISGTMTEENTALKTKTVYRISLMTENCLYGRRNPGNASSSLSRWKMRCLLSITGIRSA